MTRAFLALLSLPLLSLSARAEVGVTDREILLGQSTGVTGSVAGLVKLYSTGEQLYFRKVNDAGGVNGRKIRLLTLDDAYDPQKTLANTERLIRDDKVFALFKYFGTPGIKASLPLIEKSGTPVVAPTSGAEFLYARLQPNIFLIRPSYFTETEQLVDYLVDKRGAKRIAIVHSDDSFGNEGHNGVQKALGRHALQLAGAVVYRKNTVDFAPLYGELAATKPDAIILWTVVKPAIDFLAAARRAGYTGLFTGCTTIATPEFAQSAEGAIMPFATPLVSPGSHYAVVQQYIKDARAAGQEPDSLSFRGYFDALILTEAMKRAGKDLTRATLRDSFENKMRDADIGGLKLNFSPTSHKGLATIFMGQVKDAKFELFEK